MWTIEPHAGPPMEQSERRYLVCCCGTYVSNFDLRRFAYGDPGWPQLSYARIVVEAVRRHRLPHDPAPAEILTDLARRTDPPISREIEAGLLALAVGNLAGA